MSLPEIPRLTGKLARASLECSKQEGRAIEGLLLQCILIERVVSMRFKQRMQLLPEYNPQFKKRLKMARI